MRTQLTILAVACTFAATTIAQETPTPPKQMAKFGAVLGKWTGSGTTKVEAGADPAPWTAAMEVTKTLDGFFVTEDLQLDVGAPSPYLMRTIYGFDGENQRYVTLSMSNTGPARFGDFQFPERGVLLVNTAHVADGIPVLARGMWKMGRNELSYSSQLAEGAGPMRDYVEGKFQRAESLPARAADAAFGDAGIPAEMSRLAKHIAGTYGLKGTMTMMPGMPTMTITGTETITPCFGGHVVCSIVVGKAEGDEAEYRSETYMSWNPTDGCYDFVAFDNMGAVGKSQARWLGDDELVSTWSGTMMGQPTVMRGILKFGEHGMSSVSMHSIVGTSAPMESFSATYTRHKD